MRRAFFVIALIVCCKLSFGQAKMRKLPSPINHPSINVYAPYISLDGNSMAYISDTGEDNTLILNYAIKDGANWKDPIAVPKNVSTKLNFLKGFSLSADGKVLFVTSQKSPNLGGFDIFTSELRGTVWAEPVNPGRPLNSPLNDGSPSLNSDGSTLYFMRCEKMDVNKAENCKLMVTRRKPGGPWEEPVELPATINTGNSQSPRIMGDNETLIFSSNKLPGNKGGMDLYMTRFNGTQWSAPVALDFANSPGDDQYVSGSSIGRYLMKEAPGQKKSEIVEILFPPELKPKTLMKVEGKIAGLEKPAAAYISVFNQKDQSRVYNGRPLADGSFTVYLKEGAGYELSVEPEKDSYTYYSKAFDLTSENFNVLEKVNVTLKQVATGDEIELAALAFKPYTSTIAPGSAQEQRRLVRLMKGNAAYKFNIDVTLFGLLRDSLQSTADLTEIQVDSVTIQVPHQVPYVPDSTAIPTDSLGVKKDSVVTVLRDSVVAKVTYHNNRTEQQAKAIKTYLISQGVPEGRLSITFKAIAEAVPENRKTKVKVKAQP